VENAAWLLFQESMELAFQEDEGASVVASASSSVGLHLQTPMCADSYWPWRTEPD